VEAAAHYAIVCENVVKIYKVADLEMVALQGLDLLVEEALGAKNGLAEHIADKRLLLLFDNFEHLIDAAEELAGLLAMCANLHLAVTSRELLQLPGEHAYPVPPLEPEEGAELFISRARSVKPDFHRIDAVADLCARLDNLPLAIELAAARVRMLSAEQLLERLNGSILCCLVWLRDRYGIRAGIHGDKWPARPCCAMTFVGFLVGEVGNSAIAGDDE
jgi:predicted ATPase